MIVANPDPDPIPEVRHTVSPEHAVTLNHCGDQHREEQEHHRAAKYTTTKFTPSYILEKNKPTRLQPASVVTSDTAAATAAETVWTTPRRCRSSCVAEKRTADAFQTAKSGHQKSTAAGATEKPSPSRRLRIVVEPMRPRDAGVQR